MINHDFISAKWKLNEFDLAWKQSEINRACSIIDKNYAYIELLKKDIAKIKRQQVKNFIKNIFKIN